MVTTGKSVKPRSVMLAVLLGGLFSEIAGVVVVALLMIGISVVILGEDLSNPESILEFDGRWDVRVFGNTLSGAVCVLGGFIAVRWSRRPDLRIAAGAGVLTLALGSPIGGPPTFEHHDPGRVALWALVVPLSMLGGWLAKRTSIGSPSEP